MSEAPDYDCCLLLHVYDIAADDVAGVAVGFSPVRAIMLFGCFCCSLARFISLLCADCACVSVVATAGRRSVC